MAPSGLYARLCHAFLVKLYLRVIYGCGSVFLPLAEYVMYFQMWMTRVVFQLHVEWPEIGAVISAYSLHTDLTLI